MLECFLLVYTFHILGKLYVHITYSFTLIYL